MRAKRYWIVVLGIVSAGCALEVDRAGSDTETRAESESALCRNALSADEEQIVLKAIDDICGDTWCEGEHNFAFDRLTCRAGRNDAANGGTCKLELRLIPHDGSRSYRRSCTTDGFFGVDSLVETAESGYRSLDWDYYLVLTDCVAALEADLVQ